MRLRSAVFFVILGLLLALAATLPVSGQNLTAAKLKQSDIVFIGTVLNLGTTSFEGFPASQNTVVVRVDAVLEKPPGVVLRPGENVTVVAKDSSELKNGIHGTFYTAGWVYGNGIAVREIGHELPEDPTDPPDAAQKKEEDMQARKVVSDADLKARIDSAGLVIVGRVEEVRPPSMATAAPSAAPITEHDPEWKEAVIHADSIIKGPASSAKEIVVHFPASIDVSWYEWPKLKVGQEGTFILQNDKVSGAPAAMLQKKKVLAYIAPNTEDVLSKEEAQRVRALTIK
jgi:hypothetical protein